ncbi:riboflavin synthase [Acidihalobacter ferrooxydans]|uniref:Riboflavin synthase n=1 Tax=Acidihalobacter ferrooxydans TaxID=1765967 RepID=A0A1P8UL06_9GAMM|nr:riboflavin synthase [Acidihalobacter ferrooxydans]APZ44499.1 riboflavin synthase [Acidihalobacter ferrooxydans]
MFTGIIQAVGRVGHIEPRGGDSRLTVEAGALDLRDAALGDSIAVNGVCLTAVGYDGARFAADVSGESLSRTTLGALGAGSPVNLELALQPTTRLGGHLVSGHVDGVGEIVERCADARSVRFVIRAPDRLARYIAEKGSICVDGISLTVNGVDGAQFDINIVPHTLEATTLHTARVGQKVNLEVDVIARYLERLLLGDAAAQAAGGAITRELLERHGFGPNAS